jgi:hypothetical protein
MTYATLWSHSQQSFHVELLAETILINQRNFAQRRPCDYVPVFVGSESECKAMVTHLKHRLTLRDMFSKSASSEVVA